MKRLLVSVFLFVCTALCVVPLTPVLSGGYVFNVSPKLDIDPVEPGAPDSDLGIVGNVRNCGGPGQVVQWRYEPCTGESPCKIPGDGQKRLSEVQFIPSGDAAMLGVRFNVITEAGSFTVHNKSIPNSAVKGGHSYVARGSGGPPKEMVGHSYTFQYILYHADTNRLEVCAEADFVVVEP